MRTGRGWAGRLLLAAAFGTAMTGVIDLSLFGAERPDISYWTSYRAPTAIGALGLSAAPALVWVTGHVVMSVGVPLALLEGLAPAHRDRPLLGRPGIALIAVLWVAVAVAVFSDGRRIYDYTPSLAQAAGVLVAVALLAAAATTRLGAPLPAVVGARDVATTALIAGGLVGKVALDVIPATWLGLGLTVTLLVIAVVAIGRLARHRAWGSREIALLGAGVLVAAAMLGFTNPLPDGAGAAGKYAQNAGFLAVSLALAALVVRRNPRRRRPSASEATEVERGYIPSMRR